MLFLQLLGKEPLAPSQGHYSFFYQLAELAVIFNGFLVRAIEADGVA